MAASRRKGKGSGKEMQRKPDGLPGFTDAQTGNKDSILGNIDTQSANPEVKEVNKVNTNQRQENLLAAAQRSRKGPNMAAIIGEGFTFEFNQICHAIKKAWDRVVVWFWLIIQQAIRKWHQMHEAHEQRKKARRKDARNLRRKESKREKRRCERLQQQNDKSTLTAEDTPISKKIKENYTERVSVDREGKTENVQDREMARYIRNGSSATALADTGGKSRDEQVEVAKEAHHSESGCQDPANTKVSDTHWQECSGKVANNIKGDIGYMTVEEYKPIVNHSKQRQIEEDRKAAQDLQRSLDAEHAREVFGNSNHTRSRLVSENQELIRFLECKNSIKTVDGGWKLHQGKKSLKQQKKIEGHQKKNEMERLAREEKAAKLKALQVKCAEKEESKLRAEYTKAKKGEVAEFHALEVKRDKTRKKEAAKPNALGNKSQEQQASKPKAKKVEVTKVKEAENDESSTADQIINQKPEAKLDSSRSKVVYTAPSSKTTGRIINSQKIIGTIVSTQTDLDRVAVAASAPNSGCTVLQITEGEKVLTDVSEQPLLTVESEFSEATTPEPINPMQESTGPSKDKRSIKDSNPTPVLDEVPTTFTETSTPSTSTKPPSQSWSEMDMEDREMEERDRALRTAFSQDKVESDKSTPRGDATKTDLTKVSEDLQIIKEQNENAQQAKTSEAKTKTGSKRRKTKKRGTGSGVSILLTNSCPVC